VHAHLGLTVPAVVPADQGLRAVDVVPALPGGGELVRHRADDQVDITGRVRDAPRDGPDKDRAANLGHPLQPFGDDRQGALLAYWLTDHGDRRSAV
jgi:hypothetical protein